MALFRSKKNTPAAAAPSAKKEAPAKKAQSATVSSTPDVIRHARITEKASDRQAEGVYVFDVTEAATKRDIVRAVQSLYKVTPRKVAMIRVPRKEVRNMRTGRTGVKGGGKKAYVYLKSGETITL